MTRTRMVVAVAAVVVAGAAVVIGAVWLIYGDRGDEQTARGTCGGAAYELSLEEENGLELTFELQSESPGETWDVVIEQDGRSVLSGERQTDEDAELDVDVVVNESDGKSFTVTATPENGEACTASLER